MRDDFLMLSKQLLRASQIDVSYFAAGIISHLASESIQKWLVVSAKEDILKELVRTFFFLKWKKSSLMNVYCTVTCTLMYCSL